MSLDELAIKFKSDKSSELHNYCRIYEEKLERFKSKKDLKILEIGVYKGYSTKMWSEYFNKETTIVVGLDIMESCKKYEEDNIIIEIGDQTNPDYLNALGTKYGYFDIIIDDGGHSWNMQQTSFNTLFKFLSNDGVYFIEDLHTSYYKNIDEYCLDIGVENTWADIPCIYDDAEQDTVTYLKSLIDKVNIKDNSFTGFKELNRELDYFETHIDSIQFYKSVAVINKINTRI